MLLLLSLLLACTPDADDPADDTTPVDTTPDEVIPVDGDDDGYFSVETGGDDCDDADPSVYPGAPEIYYDGVDQACNGDRDDADQDGDGVAAVEAGGRDCDDDNPDLTDEEAVLEEITPNDRAREVLPDTPIRVVLQSADGKARIRVTDGDGVGIGGNLEFVARSITFTPDDPWEPFQTYEITVTSKCSTFTTTFSTTDLGQPVPDLDALLGTTWILDPRTGRVTSPPLIGGALLAGITQVQVLQVSEVIGDRAKLLATYTAPRATEQDLCFPAVELAGALDMTGNPFVSFEPDAYWFLGAPTDPGESVMTAILLPDGQSMARGVWSIYTDLRLVYDRLVPGLAAQMCATLATAGFICQPCPDGEVTCLETRIEDVELTPAPFSIVERTLDDIRADPTCSP